MKASGRMCSNCPRLIDVQTWHGGPRYCDHCVNARTVVMRFRFVHCAWLVDFLDPSSKLPVGRQWQWEDPDTIRGIVQRSKTRLHGPRAQTFENQLRAGQGELILEVTGEQFVKLK